MSDAESKIFAGCRVCLTSDQYLKVAKGRHGTVWSIAQYLSAATVDFDGSDVRIRTALVYLEDLKIIQDDALVDRVRRAIRIGKGACGGISR